MRTWLTMAALVLIAVVAGSAAAFDVRVRSTTILDGQEQPALIVIPSDSVKSMKLRLTRDDGTVITRSAGATSAGTEVVWEWTQPVGSQNYRCTLDVVFNDGQEGSMEPAFSIEVLPALKVEVPRENVDLEAHTLEVLMDRPASHVDITVLADSGAMIFEGTTPFDGDAPGTPLRVQWHQSPDDTVIRIDVRGYDTTEFWAGVELSPWFVEIPHEEVVFDTGSSAIRADQTGKLDHTYEQISGAVARYGHLVDVNLYVVGYTDTQGGNASNQTLSESRARSIARDLKRRGFTGDVFYQGFGEDVLAVATPDETDEERNRRAVYILAAEMPPLTTGIPAQNWTPL